MASKKPSMIDALRAKHDPHYQLAGKVESLGKDIPIQLAQLHKTLSKSFAMQRKTLTRVLGLEERVAQLEAQKEVIQDVVEDIEDVIEDVIEDEPEEEIPEGLDDVLNRQKAGYSGYAGLTTEEVEQKETDLFSGTNISKEAIHFIDN